MISIQLMDIFDQVLLKTNQQEPKAYWLFSKITTYFFSVVYFNFIVGKRKKIYILLELRSQKQNIPINQQTCILRAKSYTSLLFGSTLPQQQVTQKNSCVRSKIWYFRVIWLFLGQIKTQNCNLMLFLKSKQNGPKQSALRKLLTK